MSDHPDHPESLDTNSMLLGLVVAAATDSIITGGLFGVVYRQIGVWAWNASHKASAQQDSARGPSDQG